MIENKPEVTSAAQSRRSKFTRRGFLVAGLGAAALLTAGSILTSRSESILGANIVKAQSLLAGTRPAHANPLELVATNGRLEVNLTAAQRTTDYTPPGSSSALKNLKNYSVVNPQTGAQEFHLPGPTMRMKQDTVLKLNFDNNFAANGPMACQPPRPNGTLPNCFHDLNTTNMHLHGSHTFPEAPGDDVLVRVEPGESFNYQYLIPSNQSPGTHWYHPHAHGAVSEQMFSGMSGTMIVEGYIDEVPEIAAASAEGREKIIVLQKLADPDQFGQAVNTFGGILTVNGSSDPLITMNQGEVQRWRIINALVRNERAGKEGFNLFLMKGDINFTPTQDTQSTPLPDPTELLPMALIEIDGVPSTGAVRQLGDPATGVTLTNTLPIGPANRLDLLVQAPTEAGVYTLVDVTFLDSNGDQSESNAAIFQSILTVEVVNASNPMSLPTTLPPRPPFLSDVTEVSRTQNVDFSITGQQPMGVNFMINGEMFDPATVGIQMVLNTQEEWILTNSSNIYHTFHIHINPFQVLEIFDPYLPEDMQQRTFEQPWDWWDTINLPRAKNGQNGQVKIRQRFLNFAGEYVIHCHNLGHEDHGMMLVVEVVESDAQLTIPPTTGS